MNHIEALLAMERKQDIVIPYKDFAQLVNAANKNNPAASALALVHAVSIANDERAILAYLQQNAEFKSKVIADMESVFDTDISEMLGVLRESEEAQVSEDEKDRVGYTMATFMDDDISK